MKFVLQLLLLLASTNLVAQHYVSHIEWCQVGNTKVSTQGLNSRTLVQASYPTCQVAVYVHGGGLATLYANDSATPLANPFTAQTNGMYEFYVDTDVAHRYDITMSSGLPSPGFPTPVTLADVWIFAPGGGGGGGSPCGVQYDVQFSNGDGTFGCDTGVFQEFPSTHLLNDWVLNAQRELSSGDATHTGIATIKHSDGATNDGSFKQGLSPTFTAALNYGVDWPDAAPTSASQGLRTAAGAPGADGRWLMQWVSNPPGSVSCENWFPVWYCNANYPATTSDITPTAWGQGTSTQFMGPPPGSADGPFVYQSNSCTGTSSTASCSFLGPSKPGHAKLVVVMPRQANTGSPTNLAGDSFTALWGPGATAVVAVAENVAGATSGVPIDAISVPLDSSVRWQEIVMEIGDVPPTGAVETSAHQIGGCSGSTLSFATVTTAAVDLIVGLNFNNPGVGGEAQYFTSSPYTIDQQLSEDTGGLHPLLTTMAMSGLHSPGTITPTATVAVCVGETVTVAFTDGGLGGWDQPRFRYPTLADWTQQGIWPLLTTSESVWFDGLKIQPLIFGSGLSLDAATGTLTTTSGGTVTSVSGTTNQVDVATGTTTPVISLSSTLLFPGTITMGAHAADFNAATLFTVPVSAGATSSANGVIAYDSTAKSFHFRVNNADAIGAGFASTPAGSKCLHTNGVTGLITEAAADCGSGSGSVTSVTGTTNQIDVATGTTTPVISLDPQFTVNSYGTCTNTADTITLTPADAPTSLANGLTVACKASAANTTTTPTLNVNSLGAKTIVKAGTSGQAALVANDILTNMVATFKYNAATTTWELQNPQQPAAGGISTVTGPADILSWSCVGSTCTASKTNQNSGYVLAADPSNIYNPFAVQAAQAGSSSIGLHGALTTTLNGPTAAANILVFVGETTTPGVGTVQNVTETGSSDTWTSFTNNEPNSSTFRMSYAKNIAGGATAVIDTLSGDTCVGSCTISMGVIELTNVDTSSPVDVAGTRSGSPITVTTANANDIVIGVCIQLSTVRTAVSPWHALGTPTNAGGRYISFGWLATTATGSYTPQWSGGCDAYYAAAFKAAFNASATYQFQPIAPSMLPLLPTINTATNCTSSASPAACGAAIAGSVVVAASATTVVVNTTAVTANSQVLLTEDRGLGSKLGVTCDTTSQLTIGNPIVTARTAGTSFTIGLAAAPATNPVCLSYLVVN